MILDFDKFKNAIAAQWATMLQHDLYRTAVEGDDLWSAYLTAFPEGTNPMYRQRTEHDCSCCKHFIRHVGNVVAIIDEKIVSLWDVRVGDSASQSDAAAKQDASQSDAAYQAVADALAALVKSRAIVNVFLYPDEQAGTDKSYERTDAGKVVTWDHFHVRIPVRRNQGKNYVRDGKLIDTELGEKRALHDVMLRGLSEITRDALDTVLEVIDQNSLYRGAEFKSTLDTFRALKVQFDRLAADARDTFVWQQIEKVSPVIARVRNIAIGTLLVDLSANVDLEEAVRKFETSVMAPTNYKRPTALVSQKMVDAAKAAVEELGLTSALERRYARLPDVNVNDVLFADRSARAVMKEGGAFDGLATKAASRPKDLSKIETMPIEKFIADVVPLVTSIEVFLENRHVNNLVSLVAPVSLEAKPLFKWENGFSWSYNGDVTDSLRERVKRAGGNITGDLCCRLAWYNFDDLDLHMHEPAGFAGASGTSRGHAVHIFYAHRQSVASGGRLDVDMNAGSGKTREPVENIFYGNRRRMPEGIYTLEVHQYNQRESKDVGFEIEIDYLGDVLHFAYDRVVKGTVQVAKFRYTHAAGLEIIESLPSRSASRELWGLQTNDFHRVSALMLSPNHWEAANGSGSSARAIDAAGHGVGNRHYFFMLDGCVNDGAARGFYNEFLRSDLDRHRKVIELVGSKMRTLETPNQLSGVGFSDTQRAEVLVRVTGSFTRTLRVQF